MPQPEENARTNKERAATPDTKDGEGKDRAKEAREQEAREREEKQKRAEKRKEIPVDKVEPPKESPKKTAKTGGAADEKRVVKLSHEDAITVAHVIVRLRDIPDRDTTTKIPISSREIKSFENLLAAAGYLHESTIKTLSTAALIDYAEDILIGKGVGRVEVEVLPPPSEEEAEEINKRVLGHTGRAAMVLARQEIAEAQKPPKEADDLTVDRIRRRIVEVSGERKTSYKHVAKELRAERARQEPPRTHGIVVSDKPLFTLDKKALEQTLADQNMTFQVPDGWDDWKDDLGKVKRAVYLQSNGVHSTEEFPVIAGGGTRWDTTNGKDGNMDVDEIEVAKRFRQLDDDEAANPAAYTGLGGNNGDRAELVRRAAQLRDFYEGKTYQARDIKATYQDEARRVDLAFEELKNLYTLAIVDRTNAATYNRQRGEVVEYLVNFRKSTMADHNVAEKMLYEMSRLQKLPARNRPQEHMLAALTILKDRMVEQVGEFAHWDGARDRTAPNDFVGYAFVDREIKGGYRLVNDFARIIEEKESLERLLPGGLAALDAVISSDDRQLVMRASRKMTRYFEWKKERVPLGVKRALMKKVDEQAKGLKESAKLYGYQPDDFIQGLILYTRKYATDDVDFEGLNEYQAVEAGMTFRRDYRDEMEGAPPNNWRDSLSSALQDLRFVELEDLPTSSLGLAIQKVEQVGQKLNQIPPGPERAEADHLREKVEKLLRAVQAKIQERETLKSSSWDPEKVLPVYTSPSWNNDETYLAFYGRFDEDDEGNKFGYTDAAGVRHEFNLLDKAMQPFFSQYTADKRRINMAEAVTLIPLNEEVRYGHVPSDIKAIFRRDLTQAEVDMLNRVRKELIIAAAFTGRAINRPADFHTMDDAAIDAFYANMTVDEKRKAFDFWMSGRGKPELWNMRLAITEWMVYRTLAGAIDERRVDWVDPETGLTIPKTMLEWRKLEMYQQLKANLLANCVTPEDKTLVERYDRTQLLKQAANVAYWECYAMGAPAMYGVARIFDRTKDWYKVKVNGQELTVKQARQTAYTDESNYYYARQVDNMFEYFLDERRGKLDSSYDRDINANLEFQRFMLGKRHGILPQNRLLVKIARDNIWLSKFENQLIVEGAHVGAAKAFENSLNDARRDLTNMDNLNEANVQDKRFASGVAISEMIDDGVISFENIEWSKMFREGAMQNIKKWVMADMWADRQGIIKFYKAWQEYLQMPNSPLLFKLMDQEFYSKREVVVQPFMKMVLPGHFALGERWKEWWDLPHDMSVSEREDVIKDAMAKNKLVKEDGVPMIRKFTKLLGIPGYLPIRRAAEYLELGRWVGKEMGKRSWMLMPLILWFLFASLFGQFKAELKPAR